MCMCVCVFSIFYFLFHMVRPRCSRCGKTGHNRLRHGGGYAYPNMQQAYADMAKRAHKRVSKRQRVLNVARGVYHGGKRAFKYAAPHVIDFLGDKAMGFATSYIPKGIGRRIAGVMMKPLLKRGKSYLKRRIAGMGFRSVRIARFRRRR